MKIEVIEAVGQKTNALFGDVLEAVKSCGISAKVVLQRDVNRALRYGVAAPALIVNGIVLFAGKPHLPTEEIAQLLRQNLNPFS